MAHRYRKYGRLIQKEFGASYQAGIRFAEGMMPHKPDTLKNIADIKQWIKKKYREDVFNTGMQE